MKKVLEGSVFRLLESDEPAAVEVVREQGPSPFFFTCDHAGRLLPRRLGDLGLPASELVRHIAWDIGAAAVAHALAEHFDACLITQAYSRLVIDCNRHLDDPTCILAVSDGEFVPGNHDLSREQKLERARSIFHPYHEGVDHRLRRFVDDGKIPALIAIHSFTPIFNRTSRPWQIGVLWDTDPRIPVPLMEKLRQVPGLVVGDNEPYSGRAPADYTIDHHAEPGGLPHVSIEIRQDLINTPEGADRWSNILGRALEEILAEDDLYSVLGSAT